MLSKIIQEKKHDYIMNNEYQKYRMTKEHTDRERFTELRNSARESIKKNR